MAGSGPCEAAGAFGSRIRHPCPGVHVLAVRRRSIPETVRSCGGLAQLLLMLLLSLLPSWLTLTLTLLLLLLRLALTD
jgi:hypothetical protein